MHEAKIGLVWALCIASIPGKNITIKKLLQCEGVS